MIKTRIKKEYDEKLIKEKSQDKRQNISQGIR
jgi:hypothetical protein